MQRTVSEVDLISVYHIFSVALPIPSSPSDSDDFIVIVPTLNDGDSISSFFIVLSHTLLFGSFLWIGHRYKTTHSSFP